MPLARDSNIKLKMMNERTSCLLLSHKTDSIHKMFVYFEDFTKRGRSTRSIPVSIQTYDWLSQQLATATCVDYK